MKKDLVIKFKRSEPTTRSFYNKEPKYYHTGEQEHPFLCSHGLGEFFDVPEEVNTIYIRLSKEPSEDSYKIGWDDNEDTLITNSNGYIEDRMLSYGCDKVMHLFGFPFYASVEY